MRVFREITPITHADVFVILDSVDKGFDYPIHNHPEYELTLVQNSAGSRIVGDSTEKYCDTDLVLLGPYLFHKWDDDDAGLASPETCRVITIQFDMHLFDKRLLATKPFYKVRSLLESASRGIRFHGKTLQHAIKHITALTSLQGLEGVIAFLQVLQILSESIEYRYLASEGFDWKAIHTQSKRLHAAYQYIIKHFNDHGLRMPDVASAVNLSESAFSHFFKKATNKSFSQFLIDMRLGHACKLLIETDDPVKFICAASGFNNEANFYRLFKKAHQCTPYEFRRLYRQRTQFDWTEQRTPGQFLPTDKSIHPGYKPTEYATRLIHA